MVRVGVYGVTLALLAWLAFVADWARLQHAFLDPEIFADQFPDILTIAAKNTAIYTVLGFSLGLVGALVLALLRLSPLRPYRWFATAWIEFFRGIPALLTIMAVGYAMPIALGVRVPGKYGPGATGLAIVYSAYMAETVRAGIEAVPRGQVEAARSLGMSGPRTTATIVLPQAFRIVLPPLTNELVALVKDTSILAIVLGSTREGEEIAKFARDNVGSTFSLTPLVAAALAYLIVTLPLTRAVAVLERRNRRSR